MVCVFIEDAYAVCVAVCSCLFWVELRDGGSTAWRDSQNVFSDGGGDLRYSSLRFCVSMVS